MLLVHDGQFLGKHSMLYRLGILGSLYDEPLRHLTRIKAMRALRNDLGVSSFASPCHRA
jgi:hypothetical protein